MTIGEFTKLYPKRALLRLRDPVGRSVVSLKGNDDARLEGIAILGASFIDGKLYCLSVQYDQRIEWTGIDQFVKTFSHATGMSSNWTNGSGSKFLLCESFYVYAELPYVRGPRVSIIDQAGLSRFQDVKTS
jgi:hypothetical protein